MILLRVSDDNASVDQSVGELARLLNLPAMSSEDEVRHALRAELKRLHPDGGGGQTHSDVTRLEALLAARDRWQKETGAGDPPDTPVKGVPWFTPSPRGAEPRPGFWTGRPSGTSRG